MDATQLRAAEKRVLSERGWTFTPGVTPRHVAADAPHHALFVSFATGRDELRADRRPDIEWSTALKPHLRSLVNRGQAVLALTIERGYHG